MYVRIFSKRIWKNILTGLRKTLVNISISSHIRKWLTERVLSSEFGLEIEYLKNDSCCSYCITFSLFLWIVGLAWKQQKEKTLCSGKQRSVDQSFFFLILSRNLEKQALCWEAFVRSQRLCLKDNLEVGGLYVWVGHIFLFKQPPVTATTRCEFQISHYRNYQSIGRIEWCIHL